MLIGSAVLNGILFAESLMLIHGPVYFVSLVSLSICPCLALCYRSLFPIGVVCVSLFKGMPFAPVMEQFRSLNENAIAYHLNNFRLIPQLHPR